MSSQDDRIDKLDATARAMPVVVRLRCIVAELNALCEYYDRHRLVDRVREGPEDKMRCAATRLADAADDIEAAT